MTSLIAVLAAQTSLILPERATLAGGWVIEQPAGHVACEIALSPDGAFDAPATKRLAGIGLAGVVAWRPTPDGIEFAAADGLTVAFFAREGAGYRLTMPRGRAMLLRRADR